MDPRIADEVSITDLFDQFVEASTMRNVLSLHHRILNYSDLSPCEFNVFFPKLKRAVMTNRVRKNWKAKALFSKIDKKAAHRCYSNTKVPTPVGNRSGDSRQGSSYNSQECLEESISSQTNRTHLSNNALQHYNCLVIGSGPAGLRTAIELQLLGASKVVVVEKRSRFSRNNVLHLWPFVIDDLKSLGAKKFYGKFCAGSIDHISIRQLQLILLKISLMIGCDFRDSCSYLYLCPKSIKPTQSMTNETNSDSIKANGNSDSIESTAINCDLPVAEPYISVDNFAKVSAFISDEQPTKESSLVNEANELKISSPDLSFKVQEDSSESQGSGGDIQAINPELNKSEPIIATSEDRVKTPTVGKSSNLNTKRGDNLRGARAHFQSDHHFQEKELHSYQWDVIIGADGRRNTLSKFFPRKEFRGRLAIAITANFINRQTPAEASVSEISGLSFIYNQDMFNALAYDTNIQLENICYYKDDTHYFVMTAKKKSLLERGVLINDYATTQDLLSDSNINRQALFKYAKDAAYWTTGLEPLDFALNHYGQEDCAMFDFTSMYAASNACKALRTTNGGLALVGLVGDSLLEPFWPTGSGCARGFLSSFDAAWMCRQWAVNKCSVIDYHYLNSSRTGKNRISAAGEVTKNVEPTTYNKMALSVMAERESIYRILAQTTSENLQQNYSHWTLNPHSRYPNLNRHLVMPAQVEHLITDNDFANSALANKNRLGVNSERSRRVKSPCNNGSRKSPKKLKSANASPMTHAKGIKSRSKSLSKSAYKPKSGCDDILDDTYLEFEKSYNNLADCDKGRHQYLNYRRPDCEGLDDLFIPSISGTLPSSNNLLSLEARRARDIDECLRQRRQRAQLSVVKDQLIGRFRSEKENHSGHTPGGGAALFNELRRLREQSKENKPRDVNGPLTLLNSIRRCASFVERVKSFESKLGSSGQESTPSTPKTPIDDVKNLPQFATLQELFITNSTVNKDNESNKKTKIPVMKLSKDDWNVKCWEKRLSAYKQKGKDDFCGSTKSLNKAVSVDSYHHHTAKPERQVEVFQDRIKEMAEKLKKARDNNQKLYGDQEKASLAQDNNQLKTNGVRSQGWVSHIRRELIKNVESRPAMNPSAPNKPIKKLFEDDDEDDDGIDINKHYDHLCVNRPINKYLTKNGYTSHLTRVKYNSGTSKVINRVPDKASKQTYAQTLTSRGSSASSTLSDYSTNTGGSSSGGGKQQQQLQIESKCSRCKGIVGVGEKITIGNSVLHRLCLTCANCGITLRTNEIQHYLDLMKVSDSQEEGSFVCAICKPNIRADLTKEAANRVAQTDIGLIDASLDGSKTQSTHSGMRSREQFLNETINYNELYKNILEDNMCRNEESRNRNEHVGSSSRETTPMTANGSLDSSKKSCLSQDYEDAMSKQDSTSLLSTSEQQQAQSTISPSPVSVTLPMKLVTQSKQSDESNHKLGDSDENSGYRIARSETIDGSEQVTLILPPEYGAIDDPGEGSYCTTPRVMIDEEELQRILRIDNSSSNNRNSKGEGESRTNKKSSLAEPNKKEEVDDLSSEHCDSSDENRDDEQEARGAELSDEPSSLNSPPDTDEYDDDDDDEGTDENVDRNSTYEDFLTSEEFGAVSDREEVEENDVEPEAPRVGVTDD